MTNVPLHLCELQLHRIDSTDNNSEVTLVTHTQEATFPCPQCGTLFKRIHSGRHPATTGVKDKIYRSVISLPVC